MEVSIKGKGLPDEDGVKSDYIVSPGRLRFRCTIHAIYIFRALSYVFDHQLDKNYQQSPI